MATTNTPTWTLISIMKCDIFALLAASYRWNPIVPILIYLRNIPFILCDYFNVSLTTQGIIDLVAGQPCHVRVWDAVVIQGQIGTRSNSVGNVAIVWKLKVSSYKGQMA